MTNHFFKARFVLAELTVKMLKVGVLKIELLEAWKTGLQKYKVSGPCFRDSAWATKYSSFLVWLDKRMWFFKL